MAAVLAATLPAVARAQAAPPRVVVDAGLVWTGGAGLGSQDATYQRPDGTPYVLFTMSQRVTGAPGLTGHLQLRLTRHVWLEGGGAWTAPSFEVAVTNDVEAGAATTSQRVWQFLAGGAVVAVLSTEGPVRPFARVGGGWLRQLTDDQTLHQDGWTIDAGGGVQYVWADRPGHFKPYGLRVDAGLTVRNGGLRLASRQRIVAPSAALSLMVKF